jgi:hypothetical protein
MYLRDTVFGFTKWPFFLSGIFVVTTNVSQYPPFGFLAFVLLYPPTTIEFINGQSTILFT